MASTTLPTTGTGTRRVLLAAAVPALLASVVNVGIALGAVALGVPPTVQLGAPGVVLVSVVVAVGGAVGWQVVRRRAADPRALLLRLVPIVLLLSFAPDALLAAMTWSSTGLAPVLTLVLMHLTTIAIAVAAYARILPVTERVGRP
jgi:hypothetical protein